MKVIIIAAITLDGKMARSEKDPIDWTSKEDKKFFKETTGKIGVMIMGRKTFETLPKILPGRLHIVMTHSPEKYKKSVNNANVLFSNDPPGKILHNLELSGYKEAAVIGGNAVFQAFFHLIDEIFLTIELITFGKGLTLAIFANEHKFQIKNVKKLGENSILLHLLKQGEKIG